MIATNGYMSTSAESLPLTEWPRERAEHERMVRWRHDRLATAGFAEALAARLANNFHVDLHALLSLVDRGCPPELAARILSPIEPDGPR